MESAELPEHADASNAVIDSAAASATARRLRAAIGVYRRGLRLPAGRPVLLAVGRTGRAPTAGLVPADAVTVSVCSAFLSSASVASSASVSMSSAAPASAAAAELLAAAPVR